MNDKEFMEKYGEHKPTWECEGVLRIGPWIACYDPEEGKIFWDHLHDKDESWVPVELDGTGIKCECGEEVPNGLVIMSNLQKLNPNCSTD